MDRMKVKCRESHHDHHNSHKFRRSRNMYSLRNSPSHSRNNREHQ
jgi:hypothetical protein